MNNLKDIIDIESLIDNECYWIYSRERFIHGLINENDGELAAQALIDMGAKEVVVDDINISLTRIYKDTRERFVLFKIEDKDLAIEQIRNNYFLGPHLIIDRDTISFYDNSFTFNSAVELYSCKNDSLSELDPNQECDDYFLCENIKFGFTDPVDGPLLSAFLSMGLEIDDDDTIPNIELCYSDTSIFNVEDLSKAISTVKNRDLLYDYLEKQRIAFTEITKCINATEYHAIAVFNLPMAAMVQIGLCIHQRDYISIEGESVYLYKLFDENDRSNFETSRACSKEEIIWKDDTSDSNIILFSFPFKPDEWYKITKTENPELVNCLKVAN